MSMTDRPCVKCGETGHKRTEFAFGAVVACPQMEPDRITFDPPTPLSEDIFKWLDWYNAHTPSLGIPMPFPAHAVHRADYDPGDEHDGE